MSLTVSIALCTYNGERFLQEQLDSYARQTVLPDEVVVCDDGSTDRTLEILESWAASVPFEVRIVRNEKNLGYAQNFGKAVSLCTKDLIFLSDQDDVWMPEKIERMRTVFESEPNVNLVVSDAEITDAALTPVNGRIQEVLPLWFYDEPAAFCMLAPKPDGCYPQGCASAFRATLKPFFLPIPSLWSHDIWLQITAPLAGEGRVLNEPLFRYRIHGTNTTTAFGDQETRKRLWKHKKAIFHWNIAQQYWVWIPRIAQFQKHTETLAQMGILKPELQKMLAGMFQQNAKHYANRSRLQRSALLFGILGVWEILSGRYFAHPFPFRSLFYDWRIGLWNALHPGKLCRELKGIAAKFCQKQIETEE